MKYTVTIQETWTRAVVVDAADSAVALKLVTEGFGVEITESEFLIDDDISTWTVEPSDEFDVALYEDENEEEDD